jgi:hypothetical protein
MDSMRRVRHNRRMASVLAPIALALAVAAGTALLLLTG